MSAAGDFTAGEYRQRLSRLQQEMRQHGVDAMLIDDLEILAYFIGDERAVSFYRAAVVPVAGLPVMVLRALDIGPFLMRSWLTDPVAYADTDDPVARIVATLAAMGHDAGAIGIDPGSHAMTLATYRRLEAALPGARFVPMAGVPWRLRLIKSPTEISYLTRAAAIADRTLHELAARMRSGMSGRDASAYAAGRYIELGGLPGPVGSITTGVGWGFLHGEMSDAPLRPGDILHVELHPRFRGYSARLMRSVVIGPIPAELRDAGAELLAAQDAQFAAMRPGVPAQEVDHILRERVLAAGLRDSYDNITGYTLGYYSAASARSSDFTRVFLPGEAWRLEAGMVFHMYTSARGLAFSETVHVTPAGAERLTRIERKVFSAGS